MDILQLQAVSALSFSRERSSRATPATPGNENIVRPSTPDDDDAADAPLVLDGDDPTTQYCTLPPAGAPAI